VTGSLAGFDSQISIKSLTVKPLYTLTCVTSPTATAGRSMDTVHMYGLCRFLLVEKSLSHGVSHRKSPSETTVIQLRHDSMKFVNV